MNIEEYKKLMGWQEFQAPSGFVFHIRKVSALLLGEILKPLSSVSPERLQSGDFPLEHFNDLFVPVMRQCVKEIKEGKLGIDEIIPGDGLALFQRIFEISDLEEAQKVKKFRG